MVRTAWTRGTLRPEATLTTSARASHDAATIVAATASVTWVKPRRCAPEPYSGAARQRRAHDPGEGHVRPLARAVGGEVPQRNHGRDRRRAVRVRQAQPLGGKLEPHTGTGETRARLRGESQ